MGKLTVQVGSCLIAGFLLAGGLACHAPAPPPPDYASDLGPAADAFLDVWNTKDYDKLDAILSADFRRRGPDQNADGPDELKAFMRQVHTAYPDFHIVMDEAHYSENAAILIWTATGTNTGQVSFPPTGKRIELQGMTLLRFADGRLAEEVVFFDTATVTTQLGVEAVPHAKG